MALVGGESISTYIQCINILFSLYYYHFLLMLMTTGHIQKMCCVSINNNQTNLFGKVYHFTFWPQKTNMNPNSRCRTNSFEEFKFQYVRGDIHIHIATKNTILTFSQSGTLLGNVNIEVSPNIWNRNTFRTTNLYALGVHRQFESQQLYNRICSTVKLELN